MATLRKEMVIAASSEQVWDAVRDVGALHTRLVPGFVVDTKLEGDLRVVTFANGMTVREPILSIDDTRRRLAWAAQGEGLTHYNAGLEVQREGRGTRVVWTSDFLPNELAAQVGVMQEQGLAAMKRALEAQAQREAAASAPSAPR